MIFILVNISMSKMKKNPSKIINQNPASSQQVISYIKKQALAAQKKVTKLEEELDHLLKKDK